MEATMDGTLTSITAQGAMSYDDSKSIREDTSAVSTVSKMFSVEEMAFFLFSNAASNGAMSVSSLGKVADKEALSLGKDTHSSSNASERFVEAASVVPKSSIELDSAKDILSTSGEPSTISSPVVPSASISSECPDFMTNNALSSPSVSLGNIIRAATMSVHGLENSSYDASGFVAGAISAVIASPEGGSLSIKGFFISSTFASSGFSFSNVLVLPLGNRADEAPVTLRGEPLS
mmetsp:Transcript_29803/g.45619  ORF Transcript_29803/g.45619 Transcript_29803/m.45619 type:complete len:234 (+) Transcript_29803:74-775(+)